MRRLARALELVVAAVISLTAAAQPAPPERPWRVVILNDGDPALPAFVIMDRAMREALTAPGRHPVDVLSESLDMVRFQPTLYEDELAALLARKYAALPVDAVVAIGPPSLDFAERHRDRLWPDARILFQGVPAELLRGRKLAPTTTGFVVQHDLAGVAELALRLQPSTRRLIVVSGTGDYDRTMARVARIQLESHAKRLRIEYWENSTLDEAIRRVVQLGRDDAVLYLSVTRDTAGRSFPGAEAVKSLAAASPAPTYGHLETFIGQGIVGGTMYSFTARGRRMGDLVHEVLSTRASGPLPLLKADPSTCVVDARQLERFGMSAGRLPPDCEIRFRPVTAWEQYRWQIILIAAALVAQMAAILYILAQNRRRRAMEASLAASELERDLQRQEVAHLMRRSVVNQISGSIAHEISQPLGAVMLNAEASLDLLEREPPDLEGVRESLKSVVEGSAHASEVVGRVRGMIRKSGGRFEAVDVGRLFRATHALLQREFVSRGIALKVEPPAGVPAIRGDFVQLQQVLVNFLMNAMEAWGITATSGKEVVLHAAAAGESVRLMVTDNGPGITPEARGRLLEPFFTTKPNGLGLGLPICESIARSHGGSISLESNPDGGVTASLILPLSAARKTA